MIGGKQSRAQTVVKHAVSETKIRKALDPTVAFEHGQAGVECDLPQRHDDLHIAKQLQFALEERTAVAQLLRRWLVIRWRAMRGRGNPRIVKLKAVVRVATLRLGGKSRPVKRFVQKIAGTISGEHTSCTISTMRTGRQTKNQQPGRNIAEGWNRFTPVIPIEECPAFRDGDFAAMRDQAGAAYTPHHLAIQRDKVSVASFYGIWAFGWEH